MMRQNSIERTISLLKQLPDSKVSEVADFAQFILKKYEEEILQAGIQKITEESTTFDFLKEEEDLYSADDLKERFK
jgi:hypothetical protein